MSWRTDRSLAIEIEQVCAVSAGGEVVGLLIGAADDWWAAMARKARRKLRVVMVEMVVLTVL